MESLRKGVVGVEQGKLKGHNKTSYTGEEIEIFTTEGEN